MSALNTAVDILESAIKHGFDELPDTWALAAENALKAEGKPETDVRAIYRNSVAFQTRVLGKNGR